MTVDIDDGSLCLTFSSLNIILECNPCRGIKKILENRWKIQTAYLLRVNKFKTIPGDEKTISPRIGTVNGTRYIYTRIYIVRPSDSCNPDRVMPEISLHMTHNVGHKVEGGSRQRALWSRSEIKLPPTIQPRPSMS